MKRQGVAVVRVTTEPDNLAHVLHNGCPPWSKHLTTTHRQRLYARTVASERHRVTVHIASVPSDRNIAFRSPHRRSPVLPYRERSGCKSRVMLLFAAAAWSGPDYVLSFRTGPGL